MQEILLKITYFERGLSKTLTLFFFESSPFQWTNYQKQKEPGTNDQLLFRLRNKFPKIYLLGIYYLTKFDGVI